MPFDNLQWALTTRNACKFLQTQMQLTIKSPQEAPFFPGLTFVLGTGQFSEQLIVQTMILLAYPTYYINAIIRVSCPTICK